MASDVVSKLPTDTMAPSSTSTSGLSVAELSSISIIPRAIERASYARSISFTGKITGCLLGPGGTPERASLTVADGRVQSVGAPYDATGPVASLAALEAKITDGVREPNVYPEVEAMLGQPLAEYALA